MKRHDRSFDVEKANYADEPVHKKSRTSLMAKSQSSLFPISTTADGENRKIHITGPEEVPACPLNIRISIPSEQKNLW